MSRAHLGGVQCPVVGSQVSGAVQPAEAQPGTQVPPEQMLAGALGHSASLLHIGGGGIGVGQPALPGVQQWPVVGLHTVPLEQSRLMVQPGEQMPAVLHTRSGGSQSLSPAQLLAVPPMQVPVSGSQLAPLMHNVGLPTQPVTQRPSGEQIVDGGRQSLDVLHNSEPTTSVR
jgi:hypothetical protein